MIQNRQYTILKDVFGYDEFRPLQEQIIESIINKSDTLVIMPTGGGKSLCFQLPALIFQGLTIVVSPLISLMKDQVEQLKELGIPALYLNSTLSAEEYRENMGMIRQGKAKLLYLAPETLLKESIQNLLKQVRVDSFTIDEAHCISSWGHDFRPEYRQLIHIRSSFPDAVCIALTATATEQVRKDIRKSLGFESQNEFISSFDRDNLFLEVVQKNNPKAQLIRFLNQRKGLSGIIYCHSRKQVNDLTGELSSLGFSVKPYHAGLTAEIRNKNQELFIRDDVLIIVATIAFGMGIDKPNVRFVLHFDLPKNIESYYQEIGRAGRDGLKADCLLLFGYGDLIKIKYFIKDKSPDEQRIATLHLNAMLSYAEAETCRRKPLLNYFGEVYNKEECGLCDICTGDKKETVDITIPAQKFLSCVKRTGELFGTQHIIDVLRGSKNKKIIKFSHDSLSTYGIGMKLSKKQWYSLSRQLLHKGFMIQDMEFGSLKLTPDALKLFRSEISVSGFLEDDTTEQDLPEVSITPESELDYNQDLFELLRTKRKTLADKSQIPPYAVFSDKSLIEMSYYLPVTQEGFLQISGVGSKKLETYGTLFTDMIKTFCKEHSLSEIPKTNLRKKTATKTKKWKRHIETGTLYNNGQTVRNICYEYNIKPSTVYKHLWDYVNEGNMLERGHIVDMSTLEQDAIESVLKLFQKHGDGALRPVFNDLGGKTSYEELHILRLYYLYQKGKKN